MEELTAEFEMLDLSPLPADTDSLSTTKWRIQLGKSLVIRTGYNRLYYEGSPLNAPSPWLRAVLERSACILATGRTPPFSAGKANFNLLASHGVLFGGWARMSKTIERPSPAAFGDRYEIVAPRVGGPDHPYMLDTNVFIDMERFYDGKMTNPADKENLLRLLLYLNDRDIIPGAAIYESSQSKLGTVRDLNQRRHSVMAYQHLISRAPDDLLRIFKSSEPPVQLLSDLPSEIPGFDKVAPRDNELAAQQSVHSVTYAAFLKILQLTPPSRSFPSNQSRFAAWQEFMRFAIDEMPLVFGYEMVIADKWFLGSRSAKNMDPILKLLKFKREPMARAHAAWGAAWDIFFLYFAHGLIPGGEAPAVVTADRALPILAGSALFGEVTVDSNGGFLQSVSAEPDYDPGLARHHGRISSLRMELIFKQIERNAVAGGGLSVSIESLFERSAKLSRELEYQVTTGG